MKTTIYHNPRWGKSRDSVRILSDKNIPFTIIEYLKKPLKVKQLKHIIKLLDLNAFDIVRTNEKDYKGISKWWTEIIRSNWTIS